MNNIERLTRPVKWIMTLLLVGLVTGCGGGSGSGGVADTTAPTVSLVAPSNAATGVALNAKFTATFSKAMDASTISTATVTLSRGATSVPGMVDYVGTTAVFSPAVNLLPSTVYTARVSTGVRDVAGNALAVTKTWSFTTGTATDVVAPTVSSTLPANAATGVALNGTVTATFSETMDVSTITATTFTLKQGAASIAGAFTYAGTSATFAPSSNLAANTVYTATVTTGAKDLSGNALASNNVWSFTTGTTIAAGPPVVVLGTAANYVVLAKTAVSTVPSSVVTGHVGVSPAARTFLTGWSETSDVTDTYSTSAQVVSPYRLYASDYVGGTTSADLTTAILNMETAYTDAAGRTASSAATTNVGAGTLTSLTLAPAVYEWGSAITIPTDLTLSGTATDVWIFKVAGTLDMAAAKNVILTGGALPQNIFWQVSGAVTIGANTHFEGIILGQTSITMGNLSSINGRLLAQSAIHLDATTVTKP